METVYYPKDDQWCGTLTCPECNLETRAWRSSGMSQTWPHFYCDRCSNAIQREADRKLAWDEQTQAVLDRIAATLPECACGGRFKPGTNPKCPGCGFDFAHQDDPVTRLTDPHVILLDGACFFHDERKPYRVKILD